ncbi:MAG: precorrin-8X methylmutase [Coriobacteriales bacterium]|jgi:precorrin-8X/cobalt-precorrin-8 methylmutase|nr:precorrin-8X methylmutase [Coriobacteriales bacterium]
MGQETKMDQITDPKGIETRSFELITEGLAGKLRDPEYESIIKRVIHTTADFDYADNLVFSEGVKAKAQAALKAGAHLVTDTKMAMSGINKKATAQLGCTVDCFIDAPEVVEAARNSGGTRARAAVDHASQTLGEPLVFVVGNAPTTLIRLKELVDAGQLNPALIIAVPVGFVNVVESKELICNMSVPHIVAKGRKGGSNVAAAIVNALLYELVERP